MNTAAKPEPASPPTALAAWIDPKRTAVLVIDMQVDFASPHGALGGLVDMSAVGPALEAAGRLVQAARRRRCPVVFVGLFTAPSTDSTAWSERTKRRGGDPDADSRLCRTGQPGADFVGPRPQPGELIVSKSKYSGFYGTDLEDQLRRMDVDTLVVAGLTTECCVDSTVRDAFHRDFHVFVATDACAAYEDDLHRSALKILELNCAILTTVDAVEAAWASQPALREAG